MFSDMLGSSERRTGQVHMKRLLSDYAPVFTGIVLIAAGLWLPLGFPGAPRLIDFFAMWASSLFA